MKSVEFTDDLDRYATRGLTVAFKVAAPRLGPATQAAAAAAKRGDWETGRDGRARVGDVELEPGEWELRVRPRDETTTRALPGGAGLVVLDLEVTDELRSEGRARDLVREVQQRRRQLGLDVTDRIRLEVAGGRAVMATVDAHRGWIAEQVLAVEVTAVRHWHRGSAGGRRLAPGRAR